MTALTWRHRRPEAGLAGLAPDAPVFDSLETNFFQLAPRMGACPERLPEFLQAFARMRRAVKRQSESWPRDATAARERLYRSR